MFHDAAYGGGAPVGYDESPALGGRGARGAHDHVCDIAHVGQTDDVIAAAHVRKHARPERLDDFGEKDAVPGAPDHDRPDGRGADAALFVGGPHQGFGVRFGIVVQHAALADGGVLGGAVVAGVAVNGYGTHMDEASHARVLGGFEHILHARDVDVEIFAGRAPLAHVRGAMKNHVHAGRGLFQGPGVAQVAGRGFRAGREAVPRAGAAHQRAHIDVAFKQHLHKVRANEACGACDQCLHAKPLPGPCRVISM